MQSETNSLENDVTEAPKDYLVVCKEELSDARTVQETAFTDMEAFGEVEEHKPSESFDTTIVPGEISLEVLHKCENPLTKSKVHECETCSKKFKSHKALNNHSHIHVLDKRRYQCKICQLKFPTKAKLERHHVLGHTGKKVGLVLLYCQRKSYLNVVILCFSYSIAPMRDVVTKDPTRDPTTTT